MRTIRADESKRPRSRRVRRAAIAVAVAALLAPTALHAWNLWRHDLGPLFHGLSELGARAEDLAARARDFEQVRALRALGPSRANGFVRRFDETLDAARLESADPVRAPAAPLLAIEFEPGEAVTLAAARGGARIADGVLRTRYEAGDSLETRGDLALDPRSVGEIELRLKSARGREIALGWAGEGELLNELAIRLFPVAGEAYTYRIRAEHLFRNTITDDPRASRIPIRKLVLRPSDTPGDEVEIDYLRLVSKRARYAELPFGSSYETAGDEMRRAMYVNAPATLAFAVDLPAERVWLETGLGVLESGAPVRFRVVVREGERTSELLSEEVRDAGLWLDRGADLSAWAGRSVEIAFEAAGAGGNVAFWSNPVLHGAPRERMHAIVLLEDAFRADRMSGSGYPLPTTPAKDAWAREGVAFERAFSQETKTRPSCPALMTSLYPTATGVWNFDSVLDERYVTLAEVLRSQGFETASFVQNPNAGPGAGLSQGFSYVFDKDAAGTRAEDLYSAALAWIEAHRERNLFVYLHAIDPHAPYDPPPPFDAWYREAPAGRRPVKRLHYFDPDWVETPTVEGRQALYAGEIAHNDACFGAFRARLRALDLERDTLLAFVSDHGEYQGEHGLWDHETPGFAPVIRVPMQLAFPGRVPVGLRVTAPVQLIDLFPTVLELAGIDPSPLLIEGRSLVPLMQGGEPADWPERVVVSDEVIDRAGMDDDRELASIVWRDWHFLRSARLEARSHGPGFATLRAFELDRDPAEHAYANGFFFDLVLKLRLQRLVGRLQLANRRIWLGLTRGASGSMDYDPETVEMLRKLGYL